LLVTVQGTTNVGQRLDLTSLTGLWPVRFTIRPHSYAQSLSLHLLDRLLMPAFGALSIRGMLEDMRDITTQLVQKWERSVFLMNPSLFQSAHLIKIWARGCRAIG